MSPEQIQHVRWEADLPRQPIPKYTPLADEEAFHAAIDKEPLEVTTLLVFADYLCEHNDPREMGFRAMAALGITPACLELMFTKHDEYIGAMNEMPHMIGKFWWCDSPNPDFRAWRISPEWWTEHKKFMTDQKIGHAFTSRREANNVAALAFLMIPKELQERHLRGEIE